MVTINFYRVDCDNYEEVGGLEKVVTKEMLLVAIDRANEELADEDNNYGFNYEYFLLPFKKYYVDINFDRAVEQIPQDPSCQYVWYAEKQNLDHVVNEILSSPAQRRIVPHTRTHIKEEKIKVL
jgi:hypothetical protein